MTRQRPLILGVVGRKNSGKTTVSEHIIAYFVKKGYRVHAAKHIHHEFTIDTHGKDTWRFAAAGAHTIVSVAPSEVAVIKKLRKRAPNLDQILRLLQRDGVPDLIVLEGFHMLMKGRRDIHKIITVQGPEEAKDFMQMGPPIVGIVAAKRSKALEPPSSIPIFDFGTERGRICTLVEAAFRQSSLRRR